MSAHLTPRFRLAPALFWAAVVLAGFSPPAQAIRLTGAVDFRAADGATGQTWFNCDGENPCRGTYMAVMRTPVCSDEIGRVDDITITGLDLSKPGPVSGSVTMTAIEGPSVRRNSDGSCESLPGPLGDFSTTFNGNFDGSRVDLVFPPNQEVSLSGSATVVSRLAPCHRKPPGERLRRLVVSHRLLLPGRKPCTGTGTLALRDQGCSNTYTTSDTFAITGLNLSQSGSFTGALILRNGNVNPHFNPDGTCTYSVGASRDGGEWIQGTWNGSSGTLLDADVRLRDPLGYFSASFTTLPTSTPPPVFPMTVTANIDPDGVERPPTSSTARRTWAPRAASTSSPSRPPTS